jgi:hypothetical protein
MITAATLASFRSHALRLSIPALLLFGVIGCGDRSVSTTSPDQAQAAGKPAATVAEHQRIKILNPGAKHLDAIVTRDTFNHLFPHTVWYQEGDVVGMYNRETKMTYLVVSEHTFDTWNDEVSSLAERLCHEKAHRADDLYQGDQWSELRDTSAPGLALDTHHFGTEKEDTTSEHKGIDVSTLQTSVSSKSIAMVSGLDHH